MVHVNLWVLSLVVTFLLRQSNALSDQCGELHSEITRIGKLNRRNELFVGECYEQLKEEYHISEAAFRSLTLKEDELVSKLQQVQQLEAVNNDLQKQLDGFNIKLNKSDEEKNTLTRQLLNLNNELNKSQEEKHKLTTEIISLKIELIKSRKEKDNLTSQRDNFKNKLQDKDGEKKYLEGKLNETVIDLINKQKANNYLNWAVLALNVTLKILSSEEMPFYIQCLHPGKFLDVRGSNKSKGAQVIINDFTGGTNQQWTYKKGTIVSKLNELVLDISGAKENGEIIMWDDKGGRNQKWYFDSDLTIRSGLGFVLTAKQGRTLLAMAKNVQENQIFWIRPVKV